MSDYMNRRAVDAGFPSYAAFLKSEYWLTFAASVRRPRCYCCAKMERLQVHHKTYERLGRELPQDVVTLCDACHRAVHLIAAGDDGFLESAHHRLKRSKEKSYRKNVRGWTFRVSHLIGDGSSPRHLRSPLAVVLWLRENGFMKPDVPEPTELAIRSRLGKMTPEGPMWHISRFFDIRKKMAKGRRALPLAADPELVRLRREAAIKRGAHFD